MTVNDLYNLLTDLPGDYALGVSFVGGKSGRDTLFRPYALGRVAIVWRDQKVVTIEIREEIGDKMVTLESGE
jgi:hypothetical protein